MGSLLGGGGGGSTTSATSGAEIQGGSIGTQTDWPVLLLIGGAIICVVMFFKFRSQ